jgi:hypothetical protein|tara:strand:+ start:4867 stop:5022 length:156 start_codon:yes stop_codon:yes gene_type:complete
MKNIIEAKEHAKEEVIYFIESFGFISHPEFIKHNICDIIEDSFNNLIEEDK